MTDADFVALNAQREAAGEEPFANPRNAAGGSLKLLDPKECARRKLRFLAHGLGRVSMNWSSYDETAYQLEELGIPTVLNRQICPDIDMVIRLIENEIRHRSRFAFQTDGLVVKVDSATAREMLGVRSKSPRWAIAYKFAAEQATTMLRAITVQVGKTGKLTPLAELDPVELAGTTVSRASLHNADEIERLGVHVRDMVVVQKAAEIIPQVVRVHTDRRDGSEQPFIFQTKCPSCGGAVVQTAGEVDHYCSAGPANCRDQLEARLKWYAHRDAMDIDGLGEKIIDQLVDTGRLQTPADLCRLTSSVVAALPRMGKRSAEKLLLAIEATKTRPLHRLLTALTIANVGTSTAEALDRLFVVESQ